MVLQTYAHTHTRGHTEHRNINGYVEPRLKTECSIIDVVVLRVRTVLRFGFDRKLVPNLHNSLVLHINVYAVLYRALCVHNYCTILVWNLCPDAHVLCAGIGACTITVLARTKF